MVLEKEIIDLKKGQPFLYETNNRVYANGKDGKSRVIESLEERVRII